MLVRAARSLLAVALCAGGLTLVSPATPAGALAAPAIGAYAGGGDRGDGGLAVDALVDAQSATTGWIGDAYLLDGPRLRKVAEGGTISTLRVFATAPGKVLAGSHLYVRDGDAVARLGSDGADTGWSVTLAGLLDVDVLGDTVYAVTATGVWRANEDETWTRLAGGGQAGWGDGGPALDATLSGLRSVAVTNDAVYAGQENAVRRVAGGVITTVAGAPGTPTVESGDGGPAIDASVRAEQLGVARGDGGDPDVVYVAHGGASPSIRRFAVGGDIETFATPADCAGLRLGRVAWQLLVACGRVDAYDTDTGAVTRFAGHDGTGSPDGATIQGSWESAVNGVASDATGRPYYSAADRVRHVTAELTLETVAGGGDPADGWGDGPAADARLVPGKLAAAPDGSLYVVDSRAGEARVRRIKDGVVSTVAGGGATPAADGGTAASAAFASVIAVAADGDGVVWLADSERHVWRIVAGLLDLVTTLPAADGCCDLAYDPYGARMLVALGSSVRALAADGTLAPAADLPGAAAAAGPDGAVFSAAGWVRRGDALTRFFGAGTDGNGGPAVSSSGVVGQAYVDAEGQFVFADTEREQVRVVDALPAPVVPEVGSLNATPGPGYVAFDPDQPSGARYEARGAVGSAPPQLPEDGVHVRTWEPADATPSSFEVDNLGGTPLAAVPHSFAFFYQGSAVDWLVRAATVTPRAAGSPVPPVEDLALDLPNDTVTWTAPDAADFATVYVRWAYGTTPPATYDDGYPEPVPPAARYSDIAWSVFSIDEQGGASAPATILMPKLTEVAGAPSPAFAGYDSDEPGHTLSLFHHGGDVRYAAGTTAPATPAAGLAPDCDCASDLGPTGRVIRVDGATYGQRYAFAVFNRVPGGEHYTRGTYTAVFGGNTVADTLTMAATPASVVTGTLVTLRGTVTQGGTGLPRALSRVELWARVLPATTYTRVTAVRTTSTGAYAIPVRPRTHTYYQVRTGVADPLAPPMSATAARLVKATPKVSGRLSATRVPVGGKVRVYGSIVPAGARRLVLQYLTPSGWSNVVGKTTDGYGRTYYDVTRPRGTHRYRWIAPASPVLNAATGAALTFTVG